MTDDKNLEKQEETPAEVVEQTTEEVAVAEEPKKEEIPVVEEEVKTAHDDFDWSISNKHTISYSEKEIEDYLSKYENTLTSVLENEIVSGIITSLTDGDAVLDINYKSDGLVPLSEFRDMPDLKVGDSVEVYVESQEDERGQLVLSRRKAKLLRTWESLVDSYQNGTIIKGTVISKTKGGLIVDAGGLETFLPGSQIDIKPIIDYDAYVGKTMEFKVVKINEIIKNAVVSHKALIESDLAEQREAIIMSLEKGQVLEGLVKNITDFGAFMDLGGVDGLLYITDISWGRISHPNEILELNQKINVVVLDFDENKKRISLGLKQLQSHPWEVLPAEVVVDSIIKGKIVNIEDYGAFLEINPGVEGLIHVSEVSWSNQPVNAKEYFDLGQEFDAKVVTIDRDERKMSLSIKKLSEDPWSKITEKFPVGSRHTGEVKNLTPYGVFVELETGIGGMVHISDLSWTKRFSHPSEFTKVGNDIEIMILDIDQDSRKLSLGHKQIEENPWDTFENVFPVGSFHEATVLKKEERGAIVQLPYGLEAYAPIKHIKKEDGSTANVDEKLTVKVIEFNRDDKRIMVSHLRYIEDIKREADDTVRGEKQKEKRVVRKNIQSQKAKTEMTTLGELDVFSQLKEQLPTEAQAEKAAAKTVEEVKPKKAEPKAAKATKAEKVEKAEKKEKPVAEEAPKAAPKAAPKKAKATAKTGGDDLKKIEGIGPKIAELLVASGVSSFEALSKAKVEDIKETLAEAGGRYKAHDPTTWPKQAGLAAADEWDKLKALQDELKGGK
jgi:small subunit ribosomal protein S1